MSIDLSIITAAHAILPELPKLLPSETARDFDRQIRTLLSEVQSNQTQPTKLLDFLCQSDTTREWIDRYLEGENPMEITRSHLPGNSAAIDSSLKYRCPECGTYRTSPQEGRIPKCKDHPNAKMVRS
jgi:hypothetical protein